MSWQDVIHEIGTQLQKERAAATCLLGSNLTRLLGSPDAFILCMRALQADPGMRMSVYSALLQHVTSCAPSKACLDYLYSHIVRDLRRHPLHHQIISCPHLQCPPHLPVLLRLAAALFSFKDSERASLVDERVGVPDEASFCSSNRAPLESVRSACTASDRPHASLPPACPIAEEGEGDGAVTSIQSSIRSQLGCQIARTLCDVMAIARDQEAVRGMVAAPLTPLEVPGESDTGCAENTVEHPLRDGAERGARRDQTASSSGDVAVCGERCYAVLQLVEAALDVLVAFPELAQQALELSLQKRGIQRSEDVADGAMARAVGDLLAAHWCLEGLIDPQGTDHVDVFLCRGLWGKCVITCMHIRR